MTNIKGMKPYAPPVSKNSSGKTDSGVKAAENGSRFEKQLRDAVNSAPGKDRPDKKQHKELDQEEPLKETTSQENPPAEGILITDITEPILTADSNETDILKGLTERSATAMVAGYKEAETAAVSAGDSTSLKSPGGAQELAGQEKTAEIKPHMQPSESRTTDIKQPEAGNTGAQQSQVQASHTRENAGQDTSGQMNQSGENPAGSRQSQMESQTVNQSPMKNETANQPQVQSQTVNQSQTESLIRTGRQDALTAQTGEVRDDAYETEGMLETKKTDHPAEVFRDPADVTRERLNPETPVKIKVAEPYKTMDTEAVKQLAAKISEGALKGNKEIIIQLAPENLGRIAIRIASEGDCVKVVLSCENQKTMGLLTDKAAGIGHIVESNLNQPAVVEIKEDGYWNQQKNATDQHKGQNGRQQDDRNQGNPEQNEADNFIQQLRLGMHSGEFAV